MTKGQKSGEIGGVKLGGVEQAGVEIRGGGEIVEGEY